MAPQNNDPENILEKYKITIDFLKFEATTLWQIFNAFFTANAVFVAFIATALATHEDINYILLLIASVLGLLMCILWFCNTYTNSNWYHFRMIQAKATEKKLTECHLDDEWFLLNREAEKFATTQFKNKNIAYCMIGIFFIVHLSIVVYSIFQIGVNCTLNKN